MKNDESQKNAGTVLKQKDRPSFRTIINNITGCRGLSFRFAFLTIVIVVALALNLWLVAQEDLPPPWDYASYLSSSLRIYKALTTGPSSEAFPVFNNVYRPPLAPLVALPFYIVFGTSYTSAMLVNLLYLVILIVSAYKLGEMYHSWKVGIATASIVSTLPGVITYGRTFGVDFPLMAFVTAGLYLTIASNGFRRRGSSIALGVVTGMGMLMKWTFFIFLAPMIIAESIQHRRNLGFGNILLSTLVGVCLALPWYIRAISKGLIQQLLDATAGVPIANLSNSGHVTSALLFYPSALYARIIGPFYFVTLFSVAVLASIFAIVSLRNPVKHLRRSRRDLSLAFSFLIPFIFFALLRNTQDRFLLPSLASLILLLVSFGWRSHVRLVPLLMLGIVISGSFLSVVGALKPSIGARLGIYHPYAYSDYSPPGSYDWKLEPIIRLIANLNSKATVGILADHRVFNQDTLTYYAFMFGFYELNFRDFRRLQVIPPYDDLDYYDFILMKTGTIGNDKDTKKIGEILDPLKNPANPFYVNDKLIECFNMPDDSQLFVYMKKSSITCTSPSAGEVWTVGSTHQITWSSTGGGSYVDIYYRHDDVLTLIVSNAPNNGSYTWTVPNTPSNNVYIGMDLKDSSGKILATRYTYNPFSIR